MVARQSQRYKCLEIEKKSNYRIIKISYNETHFLLSIDKVCKYIIPLLLWRIQIGIDSVHRRTDGRTICNQYTLFQIRWTGVWLDLAKNTKLQ